MHTRSLPRSIAWGVGALVAGAALVATATPAYAWGKTQEGDTITISADFKSDWSAATYTTVWLNPFENPRVGHFHLFGPGGTVADTETKTWGADEKFTWDREVAIGEGKLWCAEFWDANNVRYGGTTCITAS